MRVHLFEHLCFEASTGSQPGAGSPGVSTGCWFTRVTRVLKTDTLSRRELTESEEDSANGHVTSSVCAYREGAKRAVSALVDVAALRAGRR